MGLTIDVLEHRIFLVDRLVDALGELQHCGISRGGIVREEAEENNQHDLEDQEDVDERISIKAAHGIELVGDVTAFVLWLLVLVKEARANWMNWMKLSSSL
jgi:hypothetical protein